MGPRRGTCQPSRSRTAQVVRRRGQHRQHRQPREHRSPAAQAAGGRLWGSQPLCAAQERGLWRAGKAPASRPSTARPSLVDAPKAAPFGAVAGSRRVYHARFRHGSRRDRTPHPRQGAGARRRRLSTGPAHRLTAVVCPHQPCRERVPGAGHSATRSSWHSGRRGYGQAARLSAAIATSTSSSSVVQLLTETRTTSRSRQRDPDIQVVPSAMSRWVTARVRSSSSNATQT